MLRAILAVLVLVSVPWAQQTREVGRAELPPELFGVLHQMFPVEDESARDVAFGDVDGDDDLDAYVAVWGQDRLFLNDGSGVFTEATERLPRSAEHSAALALCDVDGDDDLDAFVVSSSTPRRHRLYVNDGAGRFTDETDARLPVNLEGAASVAAGDVDDDDDVDFVIGKWGQNLLYLNDGWGFFTDETTQLPIFDDPTRGVALGDVDNDDDLDAFFANGESSGFQNRLVLNDGGGIFSEGTSALPVDTSKSFAAAIGKLDMDGFADIVVANEGWTNLYLNDGTGGFTDESGRIPSNVEDSRDVILGDVDGDGDLDVVEGNFPLSGPFPTFEPQNRLYRNVGNAFFMDVTENLAAVVDATFALALADVDGDDDLDLFTANEDMDFLQLNDGAGSFTLTASMPESLDATNAAALGDLDGDGDLDVMTGNGKPALMFHPPLEAQTRMYLNEGGHRFVEATDRLPVDEMVTWSVALGDVEGDGDVDVLLGNPLDGDLSGIYMTQENNLYLNEGGASFVDATDHLPTFPGEERGLTVGACLADVDADSDLDILLAKVNDWDGGGNGCWYYRNVGAAQYVDATSEMPYTAVHDVHQLAVGDLNLDGHLDVVFANDPAYNGLALGDGAGGFTDGSALLPLPDPWDRSYDVSLGDIEADGDLDVYFANWAPRDRLYVNRITEDGRAFTDESFLLPRRVEHGQFVDLDGNGFPELAGRDQLLLNAHGLFVPAGSHLPRVGGINGIVYGDLDRDGDLDGFVARRRGPDLIWSNLFRHLAWRGIPRIGKELVLDVHGPFHEPWSLYLSTGMGETETPWGTLFLDPSGLTRIGSGLLDGDGHGAAAYLLPLDVGLVGVDFYLQAAVGSAPRFTNLEVTTITEL